MPNTPALIGAGMAGVSYEETLFTQEEKDTIQSFFESIGKMVVVPEHMMNVVTCASSSARPTFSCSSRRWRTAR